MNSVVVNRSPTRSITLVALYGKTAEQLTKKLEELDAVFPKEMRKMRADAENMFPEETRNLLFKPVRAFTISGKGFQAGQDNPPEKYKFVLLLPIVGKEGHEGVGIGPKIAAHLDANDYKQDSRLNAQTSGYLKVRHYNVCLSWAYIPG